MYTVEQIRNAGTEGEISLIDVEHLIDVLNRLYSSDVSQNSGKPLVMRGLGLIKVCPDPGCEAVWHNCPKKHTKCNDCGGNIMQINEDTFWKKFSNNWFQYDFLTGEYYRPKKEVKQLSLDLA